MSGKLRDHKSKRLTKLLLCGDSGTGKTGSLVSLAEAGYNLRILDLDNGLDIVKNLLLESKAAPIDGIEPIDRVDFITVTDRFKDVGGKPVPVNSNTWSRCMKYLNHWTNKDEKITTLVDGKPVSRAIPESDLFDLGKPEEWGPDCVLVIDSFTRLNRAALYFIMKLNGRPGGPIYESDWGEAQALVENFLGMIYGEDFNTNVVLISHITYREINNQQTAYPSALGRALPPKVGQYVNSTLEVKKSGTGSAVSRKIHTVPVGLLDLKNPNPLKVKPSYPIATGLAEFFAAVRA